jgi:hypothetical protein
MLNIIILVLLIDIFVILILKNMQIKKLSKIENDTENKKKKEA